MAVFNDMTTHERHVFRPPPRRVKPEHVWVRAYLPVTADIRTDIASDYNLIEKMDGLIGERFAN